MVEKLINIIINELNKHNIDRSCLLSGYIFNQCLPNCEIVKGYLILDEFFVLHVWIKFNYKIYDIGYMQFVRNNGVNHLHYQRSIEGPNHLENMDDNYEEFIRHDKISISKHIIVTLLTMLKNVSKLLKENMPKTTIVKLSKLSFFQEVSY